MIGSPQTIERAAKDLLRASNLVLLPRDEPHVDHDLKKIFPVHLLRPSDYSAASGYQSPIETHASSA